MKKLSLLIITILFTGAGAMAQIYNPVKWSVASKKLSSTEAVVFVKATIQDGWHIYGLNVPDGGPISTSFRFLPSKDFALNGKVAAPTPQSKYEKDFKMNVPYYAKEVTFQQKVKLNKNQTTVKGVVEFMACDKSQCLPPDEYAFNVTIK
ncbi:disulfide bond corrector protein DsbC [Sphingobacterium allocomposti]|jgi:DsbC/DsbD-like thiol-disulfide interchange protein|uniref:Disulfide bond corrector protein DsbC n=1 Tax=Sphingobacterium allocomposti TaxID=415956 RepID=A0A5S5DJ10_9SPHI|nr:protein-disulfide reductase DsbD domain-containing protein [Sphingobacterium composti Yoo et al. 2007 non Ten et al. 2007]TYP94712.1 disulfide bond corrector protein DsbC [Sphingobacterium composti Yoo et al. 2007 non Ten et al. 2007]HLS94376.1 protein-disulfide reductase DsbD domain-containing protein [Sphingobacterium sp.]